MGTLENRLGEFLGSWWVSSSGVSNWGGSDLRFLRMKKPARVAERKTRMNLRGHISFLNLSDRGRESLRERRLRNVGVLIKEGEAGRVQLKNGQFWLGNRSLTNMNSSGFDL